MLAGFDNVSSELGKFFPSLIKRAANDLDLQLALFQGFEALEQESLSWARLNQITHLCSQAGMSEGFFKYYFLLVPDDHPYPCKKVFPGEEYEPPKGVDEIQSLKQLRWGIQRFMYDAMLFWGNFRQAYRDLRSKQFEEIQDVFRGKCVPNRRLVTRGKVASPVSIPRDDRYLISEMACKTYQQRERIEDADHVRIAVEAFEELTLQGATVTPEKLKERARAGAAKKSQLELFDLLYEEVQGGSLTTRDDVLALYKDQWEAFQKARDAALQNTRLYLSICNDLDVYVATSMRSRDDFRDMAKACSEIFQHESLRAFNIRYFDPTLSAAKYHEDKGLIECLMVKTCKVLLYFAQHKESLGKVSELAMALSLGKPVIVLCPPDERGTEVYRFYLERHPLLRLVDFQSGVVNGAIVTQKQDHVVQLIERVLANRMEYDLDKKENTEAYYLLKERLSGSTVRIVTDDTLLSETFWNNYHSTY